jgi:hypothetical protein
MKTGQITYNARQRGRKYRGAERNFDTAALANVINSGDVQERVRNRDMWGYYGHWPRVLFGMNPGEGGPVTRGPLAGKVVRLEPAFVTTYLAATPDGQITHEAEFQDNPHGRLTARAWGNKTAGFSSCIDCVTRGDVDVPRGFYGFDFVAEPNFTGNRGYALDGVFEADEETELLMDSVTAERALIDIADRDYRALQGEFDRQAQALAHMETVNRDLVAMLDKVQEKARLDSANQPPMINRTSRLLLLADEFKTMKLDGIEGPPADPEERAYSRLLDSTKNLLRRRW